MDQPNRIFIVGGSGSGKTTVAHQISTALQLPVHHLDEVARVGGGTGPERPPAERAAAITNILRSGRWVTEGIHLGWTDELLASADVILWLDHVSWTAATRRQLKRFVTQAWAEARRQKGWRRFGRFGDYLRRLRDLARAIPESRSYQNRRDTPTRGPEETRAATAARLAPYVTKVVHCRTTADVREFVAGLSSTTG